MTDEEYLKGKPLMHDATAPVTPTNPYPKPKRLRIRKCGATLRVPTASGRAEVVFTCGSAKHGMDAPHAETGTVQMPDGTVRDFVIQWFDEGFRTIRQHSRGSKNRGKGEA